LAKATDAQIQAAAVALEVQDHGLAVARRHVPDDDLLAVGGFEDDLGGLRQPD
jgi:hypothetical protein